MGINGNHLRRLLIGLALALVIGPGTYSLGAQARASLAPPMNFTPQQFWQRAKETTYKSAAELAAQNARELRKGIAYDKLVRGNPAGKIVALTFDDGPHPEYTPKLLAILRQYDVKATFFVVGEMALRYPDLVRAEVAAGHLVGNHTFHHVNLTKLPPAGVLAEWQANQDVIQSITGQTMRFCRPPGGDYDNVVIQAAMDLGLTTVLWTDDPGDYASPGGMKIERRVLDTVSRGGIILLHDGIQQTIDVLPQIIEHLKRNGFRFVTVEEMQAQVDKSRGRLPNRRMVPVPL